ncbi:hypothetical protein SDC9_132081 [bioreactor metagenome]|uniref:Uncharacterized protein n=1 Tax=bioreactor metagenome TaxID=1076179 RepID=A0A645D6N9_9ZZZZ
MTPTVNEYAVSSVGASPIPPMKLCQTPTGRTANNRAMEPTILIGNVAIKPFEIALK